MEVDVSRTNSYRGVRFVTGKLIPGGRFVTESISHATPAVLEKKMLTHDGKQTPTYMYNNR